MVPFVSVLSVCSFLQCLCGGHGPVFLTKLQPFAGPLPLKCFLPLFGALLRFLVVFVLVYLYIRSSDPSGRLQRTFLVVGCHPQWTAPFCVFSVFFGLVFISLFSQVLADHFCFTLSMLFTIFPCLCLSISC